MDKAGLVIVSHGHFAEEALHSVEMIMGKQDYAEAISLMPGESMDGLSKKIENSMKRLEKCKSIFIFIDMWGGTPSNASIAFLLQRNNIKIISGINIPMLIEFFSSRTLPEEELVKSVVESARRSVMDVGSIVSKTK